VPRNRNGERSDDRGQDDDDDSREPSSTRSTVWLSPHRPRAIARRGDDCGGALSMSIGVNGTDAISLSQYHSRRRGTSPKRYVEAGTALASRIKVRAFDAPNVVEQHRCGGAASPGGLRGSWAVR
jgi:hypothetical protein